MEKKLERSTGKGVLAASVFVLCSTLAFGGLYNLGIKGLDHLSSRATEITALQHKITVLESRLGDEESGAYFRRIAVLVGGDASPAAVRTYKAISKLNGTISNEQKELKEAKERLARLTGEESGDQAHAASRVTPDRNQVAMLNGHIGN